MNKNEMINTLNYIGESLCDKEIGEMVRHKILVDGPCEIGETETGIAMIVLTHLQEKLLCRIASCISQLEVTK